MEGVTNEFGQPKSFEQFLILSQFYQQKGIRKGVEHWRANRSENRCMGTVYWQLNDNWPVVSWASIDYNGRWKALHYAAKRFYAPVLVSIAKYDDKIKIRVVNDLRHEISGELSFKINTYNGSNLLNETIDVNIPACDSQTVYEKNEGELLNNSDAKDCYLTAEITGNDFSSRNIFHFTTLKNATLHNPELNLNINGNKVEIKSSGLAKCVYLNCEDNKAQFSDNYFDLLPGETKIVELNPVKPEIPIDDNAVKTVTALSLWDLIK